jgi:hypothetical protein
MVPKKKKKNLRNLNILRNDTILCCNNKYCDSDTEYYVCVCVSVFVRMGVCVNVYVCVFGFRILTYGRTL